MSKTVYSPKPINTDDIKVPADLLELAETLSRNVHENWALERIRQGWQYGPQRNDTNKLHPCLVPYEELPEHEKVLDRNTAMETLKVILSLGYSINKQTE